MKKKIKSKIISFRNNSKHVLLLFLIICSSTARLSAQAGAALNFDGTSDHVAFSTLTNIPIANSNYTIEAWIKPSALGSRGIVGWGNYGTTNEVNAFRLDASGSLINYWWANDLSANPAPINLMDGNWHHVVASYDGTTRKIFVDGILKNQDTPVAGSHNVPSTANFKIGSTCPICGGEFFSGGMDEVRIWNRALCQAEIVNNMNCEIPTTSLGLVANYHFNEGIASSSNGTITALPDASGNSNNGTLTSFALTGATSNWIAPGGVVSGTSCSATTVINISSQTNVSCKFGSNGAATISATGAGSPFTYSWSPSGGSAATASGLSAGTYTCTVTQACGTTFTQLVTITEPTAIALTLNSQTNIACFGGSNGAASVNAATGGAGGYTYNWTPGNPTGDGTVSVTGLTAGTWTCTVTDLNSCTKTQTFNLTSPTAISLTAVSQTNIACFSGSNGAASVNSTGGAGGYTYNWTPGNPTGDGTVSVTGLTAGTWTCTVTDANSCTGTQTFNITSPTAITLTPSSQTNISCFGGSNGAASVNTPTGGAGGYTYNWTPGNPTGDGTVSVTGLTAGTWTCTVTDANSCTKTQTFNLTSPTAIILTPASQTNISCFGGSNGAASVNAATGGAGGFTYNWTPGNPIGDGTVSVTGLSAGTWTCTVTDANSCTGTQTFNVTQPPSLLLTAASQTNISCFGGSNGAASINVSGGTAAYSYNWTPGNPTGDGTASVTGLTAGTWTCTVTDANSCTGTQTYNLTQGTTLVATLVSQTNISCFGGSNGAAGVSVSGGTTAYSYNWTPGNPTGDGTASVTGLTAGTWTCTVTDANGCTSVSVATITQPAAALSGSTLLTNVSCFGGTNGAINLTVSGGTASYSYNWGAGVVSEDRTGLAAGTYIVTITDANGCTSTTSATITQPATALSASTVVTNILCNGASTGAINLTATGGTAGYTYNWGGGVVSEDRTGLAAGTYTVTVTDANACTSTTSATITQPATALSVSSLATNVLCNGASTGAIDLTVSGGTVSYTYDWGSSITTEDISGLIAGTYNVVITDANACTLTESVTISQPATALSGNAVATDISCNGLTDGSINLTVTGGTTTYTYDWGGGVTSEDRTGLGANTYTVIITDANGCNATSSVAVTEPSLLSAASSATSILCNGENSTVTVSVTGGITPYIGDGVFTVIAGTHTYIITDANSCLTTTSVTISEPAALVITISSTSILCNGDNSNVVINGTGGTAPYVGAGTFIQAAGTTSYTITDANSCTATSTVTVTEPSALTSTITSTTILCNGNTSLVSISASGGTAPYVGAGSFNVLAGTHTFTVTDALLCSISTTIAITEPPVFSASSSASAILCSGENSTVTVVATGGTAPYIGDGIFTEVAGIPTYTITDANSCSTSTSVTISEPLPLMLMYSATPIACNGDNSTITISGMDGTAPYIGEGIFNVNAGSYTYTLTDANSCSATSVIVITEPTILTLVSSSSSILCNGGNATVTINGTGGMAPYTGEGVSTVSAGTYTFTLTDANGCSDGETIIVTEPSAISSSFSFTNPTTCNGTDGSIDLFVTGGSPAYTYQWNSTAVTEDLSGIGSGAYEVTVTDVNNCSITVNVLLNDPSATVVLLSLPTTLVCQSAPAFTLTGESPAGGVFSGAGVSSGSFDPAAASIGANTILYTYVDINGCVGVASDDIVVDLCTTISSVSEDEMVNVYPNPTSGLLNVETTTDDNTITVFDLVGNAVYSIKSTSLKTEIDMQNFANGIYFLKVENSKTVSTIRIVRSK
jgi:hypothetical protein